MSPACSAVAREGHPVVDRLCRQRPACPRGDRTGRHRLRAGDFRTSRPTVSRKRSIIIAAGSCASPSRCGAATSWRPDPPGTARIDRPEWTVGEYLNAVGGYRAKNPGCLPMCAQDGERRWGRPAPISRVLRPTAIYTHDPDPLAPASVARDRPAKCHWFWRRRTRGDVGRRLPSVAHRGSSAATFWQAALGRVRPARWWAAFVGCLRYYSCVWPPLSH